MLGRDGRPLGCFRAVYTMNMIYFTTAFQVQLPRGELVQSRAPFGTAVDRQVQLVLQSGVLHLE